MIKYLFLPYCFFSVSSILPFWNSLPMLTKASSRFFNLRLSCFNLRQLLRFIFELSHLLLSRVQSPIQKNPLSFSANVLLSSFIAYCFTTFVLISFSSSMFLIMMSCCRHMDEVTSRMSYRELTFMRAFSGCYPALVEFSADSLWCGSS